eukprot:1604-Pyramimonas_sp.AAC.1
MGDYEEALPLFRLALQEHRATLGESHPDTLVALDNLVKLLWTAGKMEEADQVFRATLEGNAARLGEESPDAIA